jgi:hypothetical protein
MFPGDGSQPPPSPLFTLAQRRRSFAEAKVTEPSSEIDGQLFDNLCKTSAPGAPCEFPHSRLEPDYRLWCKAPPRVWPTREAEAQEFPSLRFGDFRLVISGRVSLSTSWSGARTGSNKADHGFRLCGRRHGNGTSNRRGHHSLTNRPNFRPHGISVPVDRTKRK